MEISFVLLVRLGCKEKKIAITLAPLSATAGVSDFCSVVLLWGGKLTQQCGKKWGVLDTTRKNDKTSFLRGQDFFCKINEFPHL